MFVTTAAAERRLARRLNVAVEIVAESSYAPELVTRELVRGEPGWPALALALLRSQTGRAFWRASSLWRNRVCRMCCEKRLTDVGAELHERACARLYLAKRPSEVGSLIREHYASPECDAIAAMCVAIAGGAR